MQPKTTPSSFQRGAARPAARAGRALIAMAAGAGFALDTWERGWTAPGAAAVVGALLAAGCAALGRAMRRPLLERAAPFLAVAALVVAALGALVYRMRR